MEVNLGDWEGRSFETSVSLTDTLEPILKDPYFTLPNGESQYVVKSRIVEAIDRIDHRHSGESIVIVAHGLTIAISLPHYVDNSVVRLPHYSKDNTVFSVLCLKTLSMICFNKTEHLD